MTTAYVFLLLALQPLNADSMEVALPGSILIISEDGIGDPDEAIGDGIRLDVRPRVHDSKDAFILSMGSAGRADLALLAAAAGHFTDDGWWFLEFKDRN